MPENPLLEVRDARMEFPGVVALDGVSFTLERGRCHALVGENGAGKSTLAKCIAGEYRMTSGELEIDGQQVSPHYNVRESQALGVAVVHQEFQLMEDMTALENIYVGHYEKIGPFVSWRAQRQKARELLDYLGVQLELDIPVKYLRTAEKQLVQLARALSQEAQVIILDELTAVLPEQDIENIFRIVELLRNDGKGIIYVSHRLDEIFQTCDEYTVLMDGHYVNSGLVKDLSKPDLVRMIAGRDLNQVFPELAPPRQEVLLETRGLSGQGFRDVDLTLHRGEVVGIAGLVGAGKTELLRAIFGDLKCSGKVTINGRPLTVGSPQVAIKHGLGLVPDERKRLGLDAALDVRKNVTLAAMKKFRLAGTFMNERAELEAAYEVLESLKLRYSSLWQNPSNLSGGNQQKIVLAKWLLADTDIFLMDEPTRGIDVGAKSEIYKLIQAFTSQGKGVILVSPEVEELLGLSHRIYVLYEGEVKNVVKRSATSQSKVVSSMLGVDDGVDN